MRDYSEEFKKFQINPLDLPKYEGPEKFAQNFKRCSLHRNVNTSYSNISSVNDSNTKK